MLLPAMKRVSFFAQWLKITKKSRILQYWHENRMCFVYKNGASFGKTQLMTGSRLIWQIKTVLSYFQTLCFRLSSLSAAKSSPSKFIVTHA